MRYKTIVFLRKKPIIKWILLFDNPTPAYAYSKKCLDIFHLLCKHVNVAYEDQSKVL